MLLNVDKALEQILAQIPTIATTKLPLLDALHYVLAEDVIAHQNIPAFANSSMDGYAIVAISSQDAQPDNPIPLRVVGDILAGTMPTQAVNAGEAARIMTGAPMPAGADAVIPVEDTDSQWMNDPTAPLPDVVNIHHTVSRGANVRPVGENIRDGQFILAKSTVIRSAEMGILATLGLAEVTVFAKPRVVVLTSGDELTPLGTPLTIGKIYDSNTPALSGMLRENFAEVIIVPPAMDTLEDLRRMFQDALNAKPDLIISTAGVSVGAVDLTRTVLSELGSINFWRINLRPGKPLAFGNINGIPFFGLPGNPVSAMVTFEILVRPALLKLANRHDNSRYIQAKVARAMTSDGRRSYIRVKLTREGQSYVAHETGTQSSAASLSFVMADGLLIIPEDVTSVEAGTTLTVKLLREIETIA